MPGSDKEMVRAVRNLIRENEDVRLTVKALEAPVGCREAELEKERRTWSGKRRATTIRLLRKSSPPGGMRSAGGRPTIKSAADLPLPPQSNHQQVVSYRTQQVLGQT